MLDRLLKISSLSGALLIFCGVLKLIIYYSAFNIPIVEFLSFSEIITSFLDDINFLLIYGLAMAIQSLPLLNHLHRKSKLSIDDFINALLMAIYPRRYKFIAFYIILALVLGGMMYGSILTLNYFIIYVLIFCLIQSLTFLVMFPTEEGKIEISNSGLAISLILTVGSAIFLLAQHDIEVAKSGKTDALVITDTEVIACNSVTKNIYLAKTDNYLFLRRYNNTSICIPVSEIKQIEFK